VREEPGVEIMCEVDVRDLRALIAAVLRLGLGDECQS
jgi:hypothetical protein